jgi:hypothetical protein
MSSVIWLAALIAALNVPFGYWRAGLRRLSPLWFVAIHAPIPLAVGLRVALDAPFRLATLPLFVGVFLGGQWLGGWMRAARSARRQG